MQHQQRAFSLFSVLLYLLSIKAVCSFPFITRCSGKAANIIFVLDSSSSIWIVDYKKQLKFVEKLVEPFDIGPADSQVHVGAITFSSHAHLEFSLDKYTDKDELRKAISGIHYRQGQTNTAEALDLLRMEVSSRIKTATAPFIAVIITDGRSSDTRATLKEAARLHKLGINVYTIGVGYYYHLTELKTIASRPENVYTVSSYSALESIVKTFNIKSCKDIVLTTTPKPTTTTTTPAPTTTTTTTPAPTTTTTTTPAPTTTTTTTPAPTTTTTTTPAPTTTTTTTPAPTTTTTTTPAPTTTTTTTPAPTTTTTTTPAPTTTTTTTPAPTTTTTTTPAPTTTTTTTPAPTTTTTTTPAPTTTTTTTPAPTTTTTTTPAPTTTTTTTPAPTTTTTTTPAPTTTTTTTPAPTTTTTTTPAPTTTTTTTPAPTTTTTTPAPTTTTTPAPTTTTTTLPPTTTTTTPAPTTTTTEAPTTTTTPERPQRDDANIVITTPKPTTTTTTPAPTTTTTPAPTTTTTEAPTTTTTPERPQRDYASTVSFGYDLVAMGAYRAQMIQQFINNLLPYTGYGHFGVVAYAYCPENFNVPVTSLMDKKPSDAAHSVTSDNKLPTLVDVVRQMRKELNDRAVQNTNNGHVGTQVAVLFVDPSATVITQDLMKETDKLKQDGSKLFLINVGQSVWQQPQYLYSLSNQPSKDYMFNYPTYDQLLYSVKHNPFQFRTMCNKYVPTY